MVKYNEKYHKRARKPKYRKKTYKKRRQTVNINRGLQPFAQRYITKMKYSGNGQLTTANVPYVFSLNSIFDPDVTGVGHQPYGHDTLATLYNRYRVFAVKWNIRAVPADGSNQYVVAVPINDSFTASNFDDAREKPRSKYMLQSLNEPSRVLSGKITLPSLTGRTKSQYMADDRYQAQFGSNPQEAMNLQIYSYNAGLPTTTAVSTRIAIEITYYVECFDPNTLGQS